jgi:hypothetical protein
MGIRMTNVTEDKGKGSFLEQIVLGAKMRPKKLEERKIPGTERREGEREVRKAFQERVSVNAGVCDADVEVELKKNPGMVAQ